MTETVKHTPGPWWVAGKGTIRWGDAKSHLTGWIASVNWRNRDANARLIAAAPDHALLLWAMCVGAGRWEPLGDLSGEFCINGIRHLTRLDENGCPEMTAGLRNAILTARGQS